MNRLFSILFSAIVLTGIVLLSAICWHSVEEIHYLKSFYPATFTVEEAFYASAVELVKVAIIAIPVMVIFGVGISLLRSFAAKN